MNILKWGFFLERWKNTRDWMQCKKSQRSCGVCSICFNSTNMRSRSLRPAPPPQQITIMLSVPYESSKTVARQPNQPTPVTLINYSHMQLRQVSKESTKQLKTDRVSISTNKTKPQLLIENSINQRSTWKALLTAPVTRLLYQSYSISHVSSLFDLRSVVDEERLYAIFTNE